MTDYIAKLTELREKVKNEKWWHGSASFEGAHHLLVSNEAGLLNPLAYQNHICVAHDSREAEVELIAEMRNSLDLWLELAKHASNVVACTVEESGQNNGMWFSRTLTSKFEVEAMEKLLAKLKGKHD